MVKAVGRSRNALPSWRPPKSSRNVLVRYSAHMDRTDRVNQAHAELRRIQREEAEAIAYNGDGPKARVIVGDFREQGHIIPDASADFVFTDPPYASKYVPLFGGLAEFAARVLIPGGSLITYTGHQTLPEAPVAHDASSKVSLDLCAGWLRAPDYAGVWRANRLPSTAVVHKRRAVLSDCRIGPRQIRTR